jgi:hypothetical protein
MTIMIILDLIISGLVCGHFTIRVHRTIQHASHRLRHCYEKAGWLGEALLRCVALVHNFIHLEAGSFATAMWIGTDSLFELRMLRRLSVADPHFELLS